MIRWVVLLTMYVRVVCVNMHYHGLQIDSIKYRSSLPILLFAYMLLWQPCKHRHFEPVSRKIYIYMTNKALEQPLPQTY